MLQMSGVISAVITVKIGRAESNLDNNLIVEKADTADNNRRLAG